jgi:hypothetical protein
MNQSSREQKYCEFSAKLSQVLSPEGRIFQRAELGAVAFHLHALQVRFLVCVSIIAKTRPMFCLCAVLLASGCEKQLHIAKSKMLV